MGRRRMVTNPRHSYGLLAYCTQLGLSPSGLLIHQVTDTRQHCAPPGEVA